MHVALTETTHQELATSSETPTYKNITARRQLHCHNSPTAEINQFHTVSMITNTLFVMSLGNFLKLCFTKPSAVAVPVTPPLDGSIALIIAAVSKHR